MLHSISFIEVDNSAIEKAYIDNKSKDIIQSLKQEVAFNTVYGFEHDKVEFSALSNILSNDYGFSPFKYKSVEECAVYNKEKHPNAFGRVRGIQNINNSVTWICLDIDETTISDLETHAILSDLNHHIARTSNKDNQYKYRVLIELTESATITRELWKPFIKSIANSLGFKVDNLGPSQVFYGYKGRKVYSTIGKGQLSPSTHLKWAHMRVAEIEEKRALAIPKGQADRALQSPFNTFGYAYEAANGEGTTKLLAAIHQAKELGASSEYIIDMVHSINAFWDIPMSLTRLKSTVLTAV